MSRFLAYLWFWAAVGVLVGPFLNDPRMHLGHDYWLTDLGALVVIPIIAIAHTANQRET